METLKLNIGCGTNKWEGFVNIDSEKSVEPDILCDIIKTPLPFKNETVDEIYFIHTLEHIEEFHWDNLFKQFSRVLKIDGLLVLAYPEFSTVAKYYLENKRGARDFFKKVIYGRQLYPSDYHKSVVESPDLKALLEQWGFREVQWIAEPFPNEFNSVLQCKKSIPYKTKEDLLREEIFSDIILK